MKKSLESRIKKHVAELSARNREIVKEVRKEERRKAALYRGCK